MRKRSYRTSKRPSRILKMARLHKTWISRNGDDYVTIKDISPFKRFFNSYLIQFSSVFNNPGHDYFLLPRYFWDKYRPMTSEESEALWDKLFALPESQELFEDMARRIRQAIKAGVFPAIVEDNNVSEGSDSIFGKA